MPADPIHWRTQLMGHIRHKFIPHLQRFLHLLLHAYKLTLRLRLHCDIHCKQHILPPIRADRDPNRKTGAIPAVQNAFLDQFQLGRA